MDGLNNNTMLAWSFKNTVCICFTCEKMYLLHAVCARPAGCPETGRLPALRPPRPGVGPRAAHGGAADERAAVKFYEAALEHLLE
jgi:hypothetical protein